MGVSLVQYGSLVMKKIILLIALISANNAFAGWIPLGGKDSQMYINKESVKLQNGDTMTFWVKSKYSKPKMIEGHMVDEMVVLQNINCDLKAYKYDEGVLKRNGKEVWRLTQNKNYSYMYPEPESSMDGIVNDVCKLAGIFKRDNITTMTEFDRLYPNDKRKK